MIKQKLTLPLLFSFSFSLFTSASFAADSVVLCNYCSDSAMKSKAISSAPDGGIVHVVDYEGGKIKAFETEREFNLLKVSLTSVEAEVETGVAQLRNTVNSIRDLGNGGVNIDHLRPFLGAYNIESAHTVAIYNAQKAALSKALSDYFTSNVVGGLTVAITSLGQGIVNQVLPMNLAVDVNLGQGLENQVLPMNLAVDVKFPKDSSTYTFAFKGIYKNILNGDISLIIDPVLNSGDDQGVRLPESYNQSYFASGSQAALQRVLNYMILGGVNVTYTGGSETITDIRCSGQSPYGCIAAK